MKPRVSDTAAAGWAAGQVVFGDFEVERLLGQGGMGSVYLVRSCSTGQRFAVKTILASRLGDESAQRSFFTELRTWKDLPEHPNLTPCRFFRTTGDAVAIFADYVEGGSLADWIRQRQFTTLEQILDVAIQSAWGLHAGHEHGLVHQDVKPANVLMTPDGVARVSDFGLARAHTAWTPGPVQGEPATAFQHDLGDAPETVVSQPTAGVSCAGMTPAYCSPEQAEARPLSRQSDVWSWGVSVLEAFAGEVTWMVGTAAPDALDNLLQSEPTAGRLLLPVDVAAVLRKCFEQEPGRRWKTLAEAADALRIAYGRAAGRDYPRTAPVLAARQESAARDLRAADGHRYTHPARWLREALQEAGRDPGEADRLRLIRDGSREAQMIDDLTVYEEARRIFERLIAAGRRYLEPRLALLVSSKAEVHRRLGDVPGCLAMYDRAIDIYSRLVEQKGEQQRADGVDILSVTFGDARQERADGLAAACMNKGSVLWNQGDLVGAAALYERAIDIYGRLVEQEGGQGYAFKLAAACTNRATALARQGDLGGATALYDRALDIYSRLAEQEEGRFANKLAAASLNKAIALKNQGDLAGAVALYDRAIDVYSRLVEQEGEQEFAYNLALACVNKANAVAEQGDLGGAVRLYDRAIVIHSRLVEQEGRQELAGDLARAWFVKANALTGQGDLEGAAAQYDRAIAVYSRLVEQEGRRELAGDLADACTNKANALVGLGDLAGAVTQLDRAIAIYTRLVEQEGRQELRGDLAWARLSRADVLVRLGDKHRAADEARAAIVLLKEEMERTGRADLKRVFDWANRTLEDLL